MITAAGVGSGIDVESILTQLMALEREPVNALEAKRQGLEVELSAFGSVRSAMGELATVTRTLGDTTKFGPFVATSSDEAVLTAKATGTAAAERHEIEVLALAEAHRIATDGYESDAASVGTGKWNFASGDNTFSVTLSRDADSLRDLRDAINDSADNDSIVASLLTVDDGTRLVLNARETGTDHMISATRRRSRPAPFTEVTAASDARLVIDGFDVTSASNTVGNVIEGVSLDLVSVGNVGLNTQRDTTSLRESLDGFVANYNTLVSDLNKLGNDTLQGDRMPRNVEAALRTRFSAEVNLTGGAAVSPLELGFTFDRNGVLSIDETRLDKAQESSLERFVDAFALAEEGFAAGIESVLNTYTSAGGRLDGREDGIERRRSTIDNQIDRYEYRLEQTEIRYRRQFTAMDQVVSQLQSTSGFLAERLAGLS